MGKTVLAGYRLRSHPSTPGHCRDSRLKHTKIPLWKRPIYLSGASNWGTGFRLVTHLACSEALSGNVGSEILPLCSPLASPHFAGTSQKEAYTIVWSPDFYNCHPGDTSRFPGPEVSKVYSYSPIALYILTLFSHPRSCLKVWLLISLKRGADWYPSLRNTTRSWLTTGTCHE